MSNPISFAIPTWDIPSLAVRGESACFPVRRIFCVGRNYVEHQKEMGGDGREQPFFFAKAAHDALSVAEGATVLSAEALEAGSATIGGHVEGGISAGGAVHLTASSRVRGDLKGSEVSIEEGAEFAGRIDAIFDLPAELGGVRGR